MSKITGMDLYFKKDFLLNTGSFKERGARNTLMMLPPVCYFSLYSIIIIEILRMKKLEVLSQRVLEIMP